MLFFFLLSQRNEISIKSENSAKSNQNNRHNVLGRQLDHFCQERNHIHNDDIFPTIKKKFNSMTKRIFAINNTYFAVQLSGWLADQCKTQPELNATYSTTAQHRWLGWGNRFFVFIFFISIFFLLLFRVAVVFVYGTIIIVKCKYNYGSVVSREDAQFRNIISGRFRTFGT